MTVTDNITNVSVIISSHLTNPQAVNLPVIGIKYISIEVSSELINVLNFVIIRVYYEQSDVDSRGIDENTLGIYFYNLTANEWRKLTSTMAWVYSTGVNTNENYVWANVSHLSYYAVGGETTTTSTSTTTTLPSGGGGGGGLPSFTRVKESCFDGIQNCHDGSCEEGIDCGGPCEPCPSCSDGIQNQGEEGIDCGGPCEPCVTTTTTTTSTLTSSSTFISTSTTILITTTTSTSTLATSLPEKPSTNILGIAMIIVSIMLLIVFFYFTRETGKRGDKTRKKRKDISRIKKEIKGRGKKKGKAK